jgi:hypothetical protein
LATWSSCGGPRRSAASKSAVVLSPNARLTVRERLTGPSAPRDVMTQIEFDLTPRIEPRAERRGHMRRSPRASPDQPRVAPSSRPIVALNSRSVPGTVKLWDAATGWRRATLRGHWKSVNCLAFSPDGSIVATGKVDHTIRLWDIAAAEMTATLLGRPATGRACHRVGCLCMRGKRVSQPWASTAQASRPCRWGLPNNSNSRSLPGRSQPLQVRSRCLNGRRLFSPLPTGQTSMYVSYYCGTVPIPLFTLGVMS